MLFYWPKLLAPFVSSTVIPLTSFFLLASIAVLGSSD